MALNSTIHVDLPIYTRIGAESKDYIEIGVVSVDVPVILSPEGVALETEAVTASLLEAFRKGMKG